MREKCAIYMVNKLKTAISCRIFDINRKFAPNMCDRRANVAFISVFEMKVHYILI